MHPAFPPDPSPLEVDRVEWLPASAHGLQVHLLGRWGDRPIAGSPLLLVGDGNRRHGFSPLAEAPAGVLFAFDVPNELRQALERDLALQLGSREISLPAAVAGSIDDADETTGEVIDRAVLAERRARRAELSEDVVARRAETAERTTATLTAQLGNLEQRLSLAGDERAELEAQIAESERRLRAAEQREHAEQQLRIEAQDDLGLVRRAHEAEIADLRERLESVTRRAEELARDVERARRATAEAVQRGEADRGALRRAEVAIGETVDDSAAVAELRAQTEALDAALAGERDERERLEQLLEQSRTGATAELKRLEHELSARREVHAGILAELAGAHEALRQLRAADGAAPVAMSPSAAPAAPADTAIELRVAALEQRLAVLEQRRELAVRDTSLLRELLDARTHELERSRMELRQQLLDVITALRPSADSDDGARAELERQLVAREHREAELQRLVADVLRTSASLRTRFEVEIRELEKRMTDRLVSERAEAAEQQEAAQRQIADLQARVLTADDVRAGRDLTFSLRAEAESLRSEIARVRTLTEAQQAPGGVNPTQAVIGGLDAAASRLREQVVPLGDDVPSEPSLAPTLAKPASPQAPPLVTDPADEEDTAAPLPPRAVDASREPTAWLAPAIARIASSDELVAERLVLALLPALRPERLECSFELELEELGVHRVVIGKEATTVEALEAPGAAGSVDFRLSGATNALAPLAGGGLRRRPKDVRVSGRKRRFRKFAKQLQRPLGLAEVHAAGLTVDPGLLLAALSAGIEPDWTVGHRFTVVWKVSGGHAGIWHTTVQPGRVPAISSGMPPEPATAIVYVTEGGLIPLLGNLELPAGDVASVVGDAAVVTVLREWFDHAQGLA